MEHAGHRVLDTLRCLGGAQMIVTECRRVLKMSAQDGLLYVRLSKPTDDDLENLPRIDFTSEFGAGYSKTDRASAHSNPTTDGPTTNQCWQLLQILTS